MRLTKTLGMAGALILAAIVGGTLIGSALAVEDGTEADAEAGAYCQVFQDTFADELGATTDAVVAAGKVAANAAVDAAVAAGDIDEERATELRERIDAHDGSGCGWFGNAFHRGFHEGMERGAAHGLIRGDVLEAVADALGIESADLIERIGEADSVEALADEEGIAYEDVKTSILAAVQADLDAAVEEGLDSGHADSVIERLTTWLDEGGQLDGIGHGRFGPGRGGHHGGSHDSDAEESGT